MLNFVISFKRFRQRSWTYKSIFVVCLASLGYLCVPPVIQWMSHGWSSIKSRSSYGDRTPIYVCMDHLSDHDQNRLVMTEANQVIAHQIVPKLELVGIGEGVIHIDNPKCKTAFKVGVITKYRDRLLRETTQVSLKVEAPSVMLLMEDLVHSPRGQILQRDLKRLAEQVKSESLHLMPSILLALKERLKLDTKARTLLQDPMIKETLSRAFTAEIVHQIDWEGELKAVAHSEELSQLWSLARQHVDYWELPRGVASGLSHGMGQAKDDLIAEYRSLQENGTLWYDLSLCALKGGAIAKGAKNPILAPAIFSLLRKYSGAKSTFCAQVLQSAKNVGIDALKGGISSFAEESYKSLKIEGDGVLTESQKLAAKAWTRAQAGTRLKSFGLSIATNQGLQQYIVRQYGVDTWTAFEDAIWQVSTDPKVEALVLRVSEPLKNMAKKTLTALLLDREGKGPNPLLLSVIQEQLSGRSRPVVHFVPSDKSGDKRVSDNYVYVDHSDVGGGH